MQEIRQKYYFPSTSINCEARPQMGKKIDLRARQKKDSSKIAPEIGSTPGWNLGPTNVRQVDLLPELPGSGGNENNITTNDIFSSYTVAYPLSVPTALITAKLNNNIMTRHAFLLEKWYQKEAQFLSQVWLTKYLTCWVSQSAMQPTSMQKLSES